MRFFFNFYLQGHLISPTSNRTLKVLAIAAFKTFKENKIFSLLVRIATFLYVSDKTRYSELFQGSETAYSESSRDIYYC